LCMVNVLALEPFYGGSHKAFIDGLVEHSRHQYAVLTQPACFWKWRMRGGALDMSDKAAALGFRPDVILASDMLSLPDFLSLYPARPCILYMHENQLSYPEPRSDHRDLHFGFTNIVSCLAADVVAWNSRYHMESFLEAVPRLLAMMPDRRPSAIPERIRAKSEVVYPGVDLASINRVTRPRDAGPPLIIWNHRWEFDKRPEVFFSALYELISRGVDFRVAVMGENFQVQPRIFMEAQERLGRRAAQFGFVKDREEYLKLLRLGRVSVSTACQENFGIAAVEAAYAGALPLWPRSLSYPELIDPPPQRDHLYSDFNELVLKLETELKGPAPDPEVASHYKNSLWKFDWSNVIAGYDRLIERVARETSRGAGRREDDGG